MKNIILFCLLLLSGAGIFLTFAPTESAGKNEKLSNQEKLKKSQRPIENRYIVVLNDDNKNDESALREEAVADKLTNLYGGKIDKQFTRVVKGFSVEMSADEAESLSRDERVKYVEEDAEIYAVGTQYGATWGLDRIDQQTGSLDSTYNFASTGSGVNVYVIDSGIRATHAEFGGRVVLSYDAVRDGQNGNDCFGHGTHVAGTIGSSSYGVAKNATLHAVRVLGCTGGGSSSNLIAAIDWIAANHASPSVANISISASGVSSTIDAAITKSIASGVTYVVAAGNNNMDACNYSPARTPNAITVGATASLDQRAGYSNFGSCVDIFAPGSGITSTWFSSDTATNTLGGTSMASPHAAGVAALYLETNPTALPSEVAFEMFRAATPGVVENAGTGSPNLLLFSTLNSSGKSNICDGAMQTGILSSTGAANYHSSIDGFFGQSGLYSGTVTGASGSKISLQLQRKKGSKWSTVASSPGSTANESVNFNGNSNVYRWRVFSVSGGGSYSLCSQVP